MTDDDNDDANDGAAGGDGAQPAAGQAPSASPDEDGKAADLKAAFDRIEQLLEFPVDFPIKVMGRRVDGFAQQIAELVHEHVPEFDPATIELRSSARANWLSLTLLVHLHSREQLEALYRALAEHPLVRIVL